MGKKSKRKGKANERAVAKYWGGEKIGTLGGEDVRHNIFSIETKTKPARGPGSIPKPILKRLEAKGSFPFAYIDREYAFVRNAMTQAKLNAPSDKKPIVVFHIDGQHHKNDIVFVSTQLCCYAWEIVKLIENAQRAGITDVIDAWALLAWEQMKVLV